MQGAETLDRRIDQRLHLFEVRHVGFDDERPVGGQVGGDLVELLLGGAGQHDIRAFFGEPDGGGLADAGTGARDDDGLVCESVEVQEESFETIG